MRLRQLTAALFFAGIVLPTTAAFGHGDTELEIARLTRAIEQAPDDVSLRMERARAHRARGELTSALNDALKITKSVPENADARLLAGVILVELGRNDEALEILPNDAGGAIAFLSAWYRGKARLALGERDLALREYEAAAALGTHIDFVLDFAKILPVGSAAAVLEAGLKRHDGAEVLRLAYVETLVELERWEDVIAQAGQALPNARVRTRWLLKRAEARQHVGAHSEAADDLENAFIEANRLVKVRRSAVALTDRAKARLARGDREGARADLEEAIRRAPHYAPARTLLGGLKG